MVSKRWKSQSKRFDRVGSPSGCRTLGPAVIMGLALGWLRCKSGSIWPGVLLHFGHNALCVVSERLGS